jgi:adenylosuccinate lyase
MRKNLDRLGGLIHSQRVMLALIDKGMAREDAYRLVQRNAMNAWKKGASFLDQLRADPQVAAALNDQELSALFGVDYHLKHVDRIFDRVFG